MASTRKTFTPHSLLSLFVIFLAFKVLGEISSPSSLNGKAGQDIIFQFNTTRNNTILGVKFGLDGSESSPIPKFITVINMHGKLKMRYGEDLDNSAASYKGRISFVGDLEKGYAWFRLSNISHRDAQVYLANIREDSDEDYRQTNRIQLTFNKTEIILPEEKSKARFIAFEGIAMKNCASYGIMEGESLSTVLVAIEKAYGNISIIREIAINDISKKNKTLTVISGFNITFTEAVNKTYAYSFLVEAEENDQLRGYNITCFDELNKEPKPDEPNKEPKPVNRSSQIPVIAGSIAGIIGSVVVLIILIVIIKKVQPLDKLTKRLRGAAY